MGRKIKRITSIGGFSVLDLFTPENANVYVNSKGDIVERLDGKKRGKTKTLVTHAEIKKEKARYNRLVKAKNFTLGGQRYSSLSKEEKERLKRWGFTKRELKKLEFTNIYSKKMRQKYGNPKETGVISFKDILTKKTEKGKRVKRKERRNVKSPLYSGKKAIEARKKFISGKSYQEKRERYRENYLNALSSNLFDKLSAEDRALLMWALLNVNNFENKLPDLKDSYMGLELSAQSFYNEKGELVKGTIESINDILTDFKEEAKNKIYLNSLEDLLKEAKDRDIKIEIPKDFYNNLSAEDINNLKLFCLNNEIDLDIPKDVTEEKGLE